jgi:hypothetical protein
MSLPDKIKIVSVFVWGAVFLQAFAMWTINHARSMLKDTPSVEALLGNIRIGFWLYMWTIVSAALLGNIRIGFWLYMWTIVSAALLGLNVAYLLS